MLWAFFHLDWCSSIIDFQNKNTLQHNLFADLSCFKGNRHIEIVNMPLIKRDSVVYSENEYNGAEMVKREDLKIDFAIGNTIFNIPLRPQSPCLEMFCSKIDDHFKTC